MAELTGTLANFRTRVRRYLNETVAEKSRWSTEFLNQLFNAQYRLRCGELFMAHEGYFTLVATRDVVADQSRYTWPDGFSRLLKLEIVRSDGRRVPIQREERHFSALPASFSGGDDWFPTYRPIGSGFLFEPTPTQAITDGIRMEYTGVPVELTADADQLNSDFPTLLDELLVLDTVVAALDAEGLQETGQLHTIIRQREEWRLRWERFIDGRLVAARRIIPFVGPYSDS